MFARLLLLDDPGSYSSLFVGVHVDGLCWDSVQRTRLLLGNAGSQIPLLSLVPEEFWWLEEKGGRAGYSNA